MKLEPHRAYWKIRVPCPRCGWTIGIVWRRPGLTETLRTSGLELRAGPAGKEKLVGECDRCRNAGRPQTVQARWERLERELDEMQALDEHEREL